MILMGLFSRRRSTHSIDMDYSDPKVEVVAHKQATEAQIKEVERANDALQKVLDANHFSIKILVAVGGPTSHRRKRRKV